MTIAVNQWQILLFRKIGTTDCLQFSSKSPKTAVTAFRAPHNRARRRAAASHRTGRRHAQPLHVVINRVAARRPARDAGPMRAILRRHAVARRATGGVGHRFPQCSMTTRHTGDNALP
ncbi:MAG: hypothetical protein IOC39_03310 [Burkholderia sp.]|jgi:hypothetical protein|uniref:hypothetical protein n=2 Tax=Burkholderiaceae TaxID=119060 RepID=UPI001CF0D71F|nr:MULTISPECIES: hypothetical protein [Burkholderia]MCA3776292.1 hypothetical protein [Burkholderia sp.]MCA3788770.1 hypothetical protein [Burkholderia sp.]MCA3790893.1 hypothetical protein [Burkholderia sp.]MCA3811123.1 hypothetical protein [Burkholderia sp.]MCA3814826.1 hypothetical protein [Burkholderia sp.]